MALDLSAILSDRLGPGTKGLPLCAGTMTLGDIGNAGWNLLADDLPMPVAVVRRTTVARNALAMQRYLARSGALFAPHGKTTMCPQLFDRQLEAGAWGITVATIAQAALCHAIGVPRVLIANEITGDAEAAMLAALCAARPEWRCYVLVDSARGADCLQRAFAAAPQAPAANLLIEIGFPGGRCGVRSLAEASALAEHVVAQDRLKLCGIEGYEGLVVTGDAQADAAWVRDYLAVLVAAARLIDTKCPRAAGEKMVLSAGGSVYYDLVAGLAREGLAADMVVRSGCYLTQDSGFYARAMADIAAREGDAPRLANALNIWARVLSVPEPGRAILSAGKRDVSHDVDLPVPELVFRAGAHRTPQPIMGWTIAKLSDQHAFAEAAPDATALRVGDLVALGISHPCTTFDKWHVLLEVDDDYRVVGGLKTFF